MSMFIGFMRKEKKESPAVELGHRADLVMTACARTLAACYGRREVSESEPPPPQEPEPSEPEEPEDEKEQEQEEEQQQEQHQPPEMQEDRQEEKDQPPRKAPP